MPETSFPDLRSFLARLQRNRELVDVTVPVDANLEAAEIHRRVIAAGGPALRFTNVIGARFPLVTNLFGTAGRAELAFGTRPLRLIQRIVELAETLMPPTPAKLWGARDLAREALRIGSSRRSAGPVTQVQTTDVRLDELPALTCWPEDGGPFITLPLVYTERPLVGDSGGHPGEGGAPAQNRSVERGRHRPQGGHSHNLGMYRLQVHDRRTTGMHWQIGKGGGFHYAIAEQQNRPLPVTVFLGGPPALMLAAIAPLPENVPELMLASLLAGERLALVESRLGPHRLVANAEFALIGEVPPHERKPEGPFGDHYGYYSLQHDYPVFHVQRIAHRQDAIYPATVVGKPRQEDFYIGDLLQELLSPLFPLVMPAVRALWSYGETGYHSLAAAIVRERYGREAMASAFRILGEGQLSLTKFLLVTDRPVDLKDFRATLTHVLERTRPEADLYVFSNLAMDTLDYTGPRVNEGSKGVWLGLGDPIRTLPHEFRPSSASGSGASGSGTGGPGASGVPQGVRDVRVFCPGCLVITAPAFQDEPSAASRFAADPAFAGWPLIVLSDDAARATASPMNFLWTTFTRFEPAADLHAAGKRIVRNHLSFTPPVAIDARMKPWFPKELTCRPDIAARVTQRWREYFPQSDVEMGDSEKASLT